ncbi:Cytidine/deoxycytidylate deaminase family protein [Euphorbia peplus]|nr:Cytidine/deoxycytidylate deaminase family protein [Euphorbia peplus]
MDGGCVLSIWVQIYKELYNCLCPGQATNPYQSTIHCLCVCLFCSAEACKCSHKLDLLRRLNQIAPLENLRHVKRIQKRHAEGKTQLSVILCLATENEDHFNNLPLDVVELSNSYQLSPFITKVCKYAATSKEEWEEQCKFWPTSYHPPTYNIDGISGFGDEDSHSIFKFMKLAINMAKSADSSIGNAAVIVDPSGHLIIASGCDHVWSWHAPVDKISNGNIFPKQPASVTVNPDVSNGHESIIENNSRDRHLFPTSSRSQEKSCQHMESSSARSPAKQKTDLY